MKTILVRDLKNALKNPLLYLGMVVIGIGLFSILSPYLSLSYFSQNTVFPEMDEIEIHETDADVTEGYIPAIDTANGTYELVMNRLERQLPTYLSLTAEETARFLEAIQGMSTEEIESYLEKEYGVTFDMDSFAVQDDDVWKGSPTEVNRYISDALEKERYTEYFGRAYCDFLGLFICLFGIIFLIPFFWDDSKRNVYEILHTKPISGVNYILGKVLGGVFSLLFIVVVLTILFSSLATLHANAADFPASWWDLWRAVLLYVIPNVIYMVCMYMGIVMIFKSPIPAIPLLTIHLFYSHLGGIDSFAAGGYRVPSLAMLIRFPGKFFETAVPPQAIDNQIFLLIMSVVMIFVAVNIWNRRRY